MKKLILSFALLSLAAGSAIAQDKKHVVSTQGTPDAVIRPQGTPAATAPASTLVPENVAFKSDSYDFGSIEEGAAAEHVFVFTNTGKEPLIVQRVQPSCGCTTPDWTKEPVAPGKTGMIKASYGTQGRPGHFEKTMTVFTNAGTKMVSFKGTVEKAPESSVPQNNSVMRAN